MARSSSSRPRSICPVACSLDILGDKWTLLIIRDLFCGKSHYSEFLKSPERIATNILAARLEQLLKYQLIRADESTKREGSIAYRLTPRGQSLRPLLESMRDWGLENIKGTEARLQPLH